MKAKFSHVTPNNHVFYQIDGDLPSGWYFLSFTYKGKHSVPIRLYWTFDQAGFKQTWSEEIGLLDSKLVNQHLFSCYLSPHLTKLQVSLEFEEETPHELAITQATPMLLNTFLSLAWSKKHQHFNIEWDGTNHLMNYNRYRAFKLLENKRNLAPLLTAMRHDIPDEHAYYLLQEKEPALNLCDGPVVSVVIPVYDVNIKYLLEAVRSVQNQSYQAVDCIVVIHESIPDNLIDQFKEEVHNQNLRIMKGSGVGTKASLINQGLSVVMGEQVLILQPDDRLAVNGIAWLMRTEADVVYSHEAYINETGTFVNVYEKPAWSPELLLAHNYLGTGVMISTKLLKSSGAFRTQYGQASDYDFYLRITEVAASVERVEKYAYHKRLASDLCEWESDETRQQETVQLGKKALEEALVRRKQSGKVFIKDEESNLYAIRMNVPDQVKISILICTRDQPGLLERCLVSIFEKTTYQHFEVLVVDNGSVENETAALFEKWKQQEANRFRVIRDDRPFNFSALNNEAVKKSTGELIVLLNNDIEVLSSMWLEDMAGYAIQEEIGAVGALLYYQSGHVQHAGAIFNDVAPIHSFYKGLLGDNAVSKLVQLQRNFLAVTGACLMVKRSLYEEVGGLDEAFESSYNDMHFCMELYARGKRNVLIPEAKLYHHESISRGRLQTIDKQEEWMRELGRFRSLWGHYFQKDPFVSSHTF
ncbi:glycosyltransferase family 2 protein [Bacillus sp. Marseille-P3800]|uniref:glycosyltransferase family 2 protein n=1 Tax=Bacillus sp. Marseille-P3800 TaxID=2014782 RepID=UPI00159B9760|nr:glycosyltransferase family 2 protein [Bacillus sp. Marseille-P3800]